MTAHDPRVTLTAAEVERLCDALEDCDAEYRVERRVAREVEHLIAARLAPIRALADEWEAEDWRVGQFTSRFEWAYTALRAALDAPVRASQDHDGAEGQGEGEKPADRRCPTCGIPFAHYTHDPQGRPL